MFARQVLRPARTLQSHVRRYATEQPQKSSGNNAAIAGILGLVAVGGGYWYYNQPAGAARGIGGHESQAAGMPPSKTEEQNVPAQSTATNTSSKVAFTGGDQGFVSLLLQDVETVNHNTKKFRFKLPEEDMTSGLNVASAVITKYKGPEMQKPVIRPYTPVSDLDAVGHVDFIVKKYPNGPMSEHMHDMNPGQRLDIKGPIPKYPWSANKHDHVVFIAGGTGITPMYQVAQAIFKNPEDKTKVTLVFGNISEEDILLKHEFEHLENTYPQRFRAFYVLDNPPKEWNGGKGYVTKELLKTVMPEPKLGDKVKVFVCGPPGMYKAISGPKKSPSDQGDLSGMLAELGYSKEQVYKF